MSENEIISRRNFVKASGVASAGILLGAPNIIRAESLRAPSDEIRVAFIGCGKQHLVLWDVMKNIPGLRFVAACDIMWESRLKATVGRVRGTFGNMMAYYTDAEEMLTKEGKNIDAVIVTTPDFWHAPHTVMALEAGCHVYCEKMMSDTLEGARSMVEAMDRTGKLCQIGHQRRSNPRYRFVLDELIRKHRLCGKILNVNGQWNRSLGSSNDQTYAVTKHLPDAATLRQYGFNGGTNKQLSLEELQRRFLNWRFYKALSGGPISDLGAHQIDIFNWYLKARPKSLVASGGRSYFKDREHFDNVMCIFDYDTPDGNARAFYQVLTTTSAGGGYYESFMGTEGTIEISEREAFTNIYKESGADGAKWDDLVARGYLKKGAVGVAAGGPDAIASYASPPPDRYSLPGGLGVIKNLKGKSRHKPPHQPHVENFFDAIRGNATLTCDARHALESEAPIYWVNEAAETGESIKFTEEHLRV
ncbi:MAG: Gfo/Idh/MocA family oxidoreductase [Verrucomicrobiota bacterium]